MFVAFTVFGVGVLISGLRFAVIWLWFDAEICDSGGFVWVAVLRFV